ncbi:hypothetical protein C8R41DRAFT_561640 [Lentinula lateritia]|uniref:Uncharacterized protein n=1 Tax=Lentinula lateritia TaxID=40482 RepID=A0ABQ8V568_9AGAR|nr:hypothetical protein C8R41DRAFT_561640 [Lentinula lateritia]
MSNAERVSLHLSVNLSGRNSHFISVHVASLSGPIAILPSQKVSNETSQSIAVELERRFLSSRKVEAPSCRNLTKDDFEKLPGASKLKATATERWGKHFSVKLNDPKEPQYPAEVCVKPTTVKFTGKPECHVTNATTGGELTGTTGTSALGIAQGTTTSGQFTISSAASISLSSSFMTSVSFPAITDIMDATTVNVGITNTQTTSFTTTYTSTTTMTLTMSSPEGESCNASQTMKLCTIQAIGEVVLYARGFVGFDYGSAVTDKTEKTKKGEKNEEHYKWFLPFDSLSEADISSTATFQGSTTSNIHGKYQGNCA